MGPPRKWTDAETQLLVSLYPRTPAKEIGCKLGRSAMSVYQRVATLGMTRPKDLPRRWKPIGSERVEKGMLLRKVSDGNGDRDWKRVEVLEWEALNGMIPAGHVLAVKNRALPRTLGNMELMSMQDLQRKAIKAANDYPPEYLSIRSLKGQITKIVNRKVREVA